MKLIWNSLICLLCIPFSLAAATNYNAEKIIGSWEISDQNETPRYRAVFIGKFNKLRMVDCKLTVDVEGKVTNAVACDLKPNKGVILEYSERRDIYKVANPGSSISLKVDEDTMVEAGLFGFGQSVWKRSKPNTTFLFYNIDSL